MDPADDALLAVGGGVAASSASASASASVLLAATGAARSLFLGRGGGSSSSSGGAVVVVGARSGPDAAYSGTGGSSSQSQQQRQQQQQGRRPQLRRPSPATPVVSARAQPQPQPQRQQSAALLPRLGSGFPAAGAATTSTLLPSLAWPRPVLAAAKVPCCAAGGGGGGLGGGNGGASGGGGGNGGGGSNNPLKAALDAIPPRDDALPRPPGARPSAPPRRRVLIMMSNTGGGHRASAEAIAQAFEEVHGNGGSGGNGGNGGNGGSGNGGPSSCPYEVLIADMWADHTPAPFSAIPNSYSFVVRHAFIWRGTYHGLNPRLCHYPYFSAVQAFVGASLRDALDAFDPDLVVSVHPLMQHIPVRVLAARAAAAVREANGARTRAVAALAAAGGASGGGGGNAALPPRLCRDDVAVPFATVVTDFTTCHNTWFYPGVDRCFVPTDFAADLARRMGLTRPGQVVVHGLPIRPCFARMARRRPQNGLGPTPPREKARAKARVGLPRGKPAVLLIGGGEGMGSLEATVRALDASVGGAASCAVVCGRNRALLDKLRADSFPGGLSVVPVGFVDNMDEWMAAADLVITKAGPGTLAEALISGLPILINGNVPCQEEGNIPYVVDNGAGACERDPARIGAIVAGWLSPGGRPAFEEMARRARLLGRPEAVFDIARDLAALADEGAERRRRLKDARAASEGVRAGAAAAAEAPGGGGGRRRRPPSAAWCDGWAAAG